MLIYLRLFRGQGRWALIIGGVISRLPLAVVGFGTVLLITGSTESFGLAGAASSAVLIAGATGGPLLGSFADRFGQRFVLLAAAAVHPLAVVGLVVSVRGEWPVPFVFVFALCTGATVVPIASFVRARWAKLVSGDQLHTAFSLEAVLDELVWIGGPALAAILSAMIDPAAGLAIAALFGTVGYLTLAFDTKTQPTLGKITSHVAHRSETFEHRAIVVALIGCVFLGTSFGIADVSAVGMATADGVPALSGVILGIYALGSAIGGLIFGVLRFGWASESNFIFAALLLPVLFAPTALAPNTWWIMGAGFVAGLAVSPFNIAANRLVQDRVPSAVLTQSLAWINTTILAGMAIGLWAGGFVVEEFGPRAGYVSAALLTLGPALIIIIVTPAAFAGLWRDAVSRRHADHPNQENAYEPR